MVVFRSERAIIPLIYVALAITTLAVYWQVADHEFLIWDDNGYVYANSMVRSGLTWDNFVWSFGIHGPGQWHPLAWWSHQLDSELFGSELTGPAAGRHHWVNLALHGAAALALLTAFWRLTDDFWPSALVAALFALHPLNVESVAWVSERRDTLSTLFWALVLWSYAAYAHRGGPGRYLLVLLLFALGLMAKPMLVTLPCVLLLLDYWPLNRMQFGAWSGQHEPATAAPTNPKSEIRNPKLNWLLLEKVPFFVLSGLSIWLSYLCQQDTGAVVSLGAHSFGERLANAAQSYVLYLRNMLWPVKLSPIYPYPISFETWRVAGAVVLLVAITAAAIYFGRKRGYLLVGWLWYLGTLVPVIGLLKMGTNVSMADRWVYVPLLGIYLAFAWTLADWIQRRPAAQYAVTIGVAVIFLILLPLTWRQVAVWHDDLSLFGHALAVTENNYVAEFSLGVAYKDRELPEKAIVHYRKAVQINPMYAKAHNNLGAVLQSLGRTKEAIRHHEAALRIEPKHDKAHYNLAIALESVGRREEAIEHYQAALAIDADHVEAHNNLGVVLQKVGRAEEAIAHYQAALKIKPNYAKAHDNLGAALQSLGRFEEAIVHHQAALQLKPDFANAQNNWALALQALGRLEEAIHHLQSALQIQPDYVEAHNNLGNLFQRLGRLGEAVEHYQDALQTNPDSAMVHVNLGEALLRIGRIEDAIRYFREAVQNAPEALDAHFRLAQILIQTRQQQEAVLLLEKILQKNPDNAEAHNHLGLCLLQLGRLDEAEDQFQEALRSQPDSQSAHSNLGRILLLRKQYEQAVTHYEQALRLQPDHLVVLNDLAWLWATCAEAEVRDGQRAVGLAEKAARLTGHKNFSLLDTLSAAHAEAGDFEAAIRWQKKAIELAPPEKKEALRRRLELYHAGKPFRDAPAKSNDGQ